MSKTKFQPLVGFYDFDVEFPTGTPEEIYDYLMDTRNECIEKFNNDKNFYTHGMEDCVITSTTFTEQYNYHGCDYVFRIHYRETEDSFQKRCADQTESAVESCNSQYQSIREVFNEKKK